MINSEGIKWLGFSDEDSVLGISHSSVNCPAAELADEWRRQDVLALNSKSSKKILSYVCAGGNIWRLVLGEKKAFCDDKMNQKQILVHFSEFTQFGVLDIFPFLKKRNGFPRKEQIAVTLMEKYPLKNNRELSVIESECLFFLLRGK